MEHDREIEERTCWRTPEKTKRLDKDCNFFYLYCFVFIIYIYIYIFPFLYLYIS